MPVSRLLAVIKKHRQEQFDGHCLRLIVLPFLVYGWYLAFEITQGEK